MKELEIIESKETREKLMDRVDVLDKVKKVILLPYEDSMTRKQVAEYYEVSEDTIKKLATRHIDELTLNGMVKLENESLKEFKSHFDGETLSLTKLNKANRVLNIFTRRAILNVGMLLRDGEIAHQVRTSLLNMSENKEAIQQEVNNIDTEKLLALDVLYAKTDNERMVNLGKFINYKDEQKAKIEAEKKVAVEKIENLTKSDATMGLREAKNNLGVKEKSLRNFILENKYCYRKHKKDDKKGNPTGALMPYEQYTKGDTRYFTIIKQIDRIGNPHSQMVFTIDGIEHFRKLKSEIEKF